MGIERELRGGFGYGTMRWDSTKTLNPQSPTNTSTVKLLFPQRAQHTENRQHQFSSRLTVSYTVQLSAAEGACCMMRVDTPMNRERMPSSFYASSARTGTHHHQLARLPEAGVLPLNNDAVSSLRLDARFDDI